MKGSFCDHAREGRVDRGKWGKNIDSKERVERTLDSEGPRVRDVRVDHRCPDIALIIGSGGGHNPTYDDRLSVATDCNGGFELDPQFWVDIFIMESHV